MDMDNLLNKIDVISENADEIDNVLDLLEPGSVYLIKVEDTNFSWTTELGRKKCEATKRLYIREINYETIKDVYKGGVK